MGSTPALSASFIIVLELIMKYKLSNIYKVSNTKAYRTAKKYYYMCRDQHETAYLFTSDDLEDAKIRAEKNPEDVPALSEFVEESGFPWVAVVVSIVAGAMIPIAGYYLGQMLS